jgi:hypothetical protein
MGSKATLEENICTCKKEWCGYNVKNLASLPDKSTASLSGSLNQRKKERKKERKKGSLRYLITR